MTISIGDHLPDITVNLVPGGERSLKEYAGHIVIFYFYPKDNTPGCTKESKGFRDAYADFQALGARIIGVSRDSVRSHERFIEKKALPFELISDTEETLCQHFDVMTPKNMFGKIVRGISRSTFIFDASGQLTHEWRKVKVSGHVDEVLTVTQQLCGVDADSR